MMLAHFQKFHCVKCGFVGNPKLSRAGKVLTALWLVVLVVGLFLWPLLFLWAVATVAAVLLFEKICCCEFKNAL
jgi:hypothetical protein